MDNGKSIPAGIWVLFAVMLAPTLVPLMIGVPVIGAIVGSVAGSIFILCIVRWVNRRDRARLAKRPPDPH